MEMLEMLALVLAVEHLVPVAVPVASHLVLEMTAAMVQGRLIILEEGAVEWEASAGKTNCLPVVLACPTHLVALRIHLLVEAVVVHMLVPVFLPVAWETMVEVMAVQPT